MFYRDYFEYRRILIVLMSFYLLTLLAITATYLPVWKNSDTQFDAMLDTPLPHKQVLKLAATTEFERKNFNEALKYVEILRSYGEIPRDDEIFIEGMYGLVEVSCGQTERGIARINNFLSKSDWFWIRTAPPRFIRNCILTSANWHLAQRKKENVHYAANLYFMASQMADGYSEVDKFNFEGVAKMLTGHYAEAETCFAKALALSPDDGNIRKNLESARRRNAQTQNRISNPAR